MINKKYNLGKSNMIKRADGSSSRRGLWDNIRANAGSGKEPTKQMLEQEKKITARRGLKYPDGKGKKITGYAYPMEEELGIGGQVNYGNTNLSGDLSKYYKNLKVNQNIPINKNLNLNLGFESGNISKYKQNSGKFEPGFNVGLTKTFPDGKGGNKKIVYVEDPEQFKMEQQARTDSTSSAQQMIDLKLKNNQISEDYKKQAKLNDSMTDEEYEANDFAAEKKLKNISDSASTIKERIDIKKEWSDKGIEPSRTEQAKIKGGFTKFGMYDFPKTTVELKKKEKPVEAIVKKSVETTAEIPAEDKYFEEGTKLKDGTTMTKLGETIKDKPSFTRLINEIKYPTDLPEEEIQSEDKEEGYFENKNNTGKIKYITDGSGPTKYFFINSDGTQIGITKAEAERKQKIDSNVKIIDLYKVKGTNKMKQVKKKMPMGIKYNNGRKGQYTYSKGKKKYPLGLALGALVKGGAAAGAGASAGAAGGAAASGGLMSKLGGAMKKSGTEGSPLDKGLGIAGKGLGLASGVASIMGQYGASGNEDANKVAGIFNNANSVTNTMQGAMKSPQDKIKEKLGMKPKAGANEIVPPEKSKFGVKGLPGKDGATTGDVGVDPISKFAPPELRMGLKYKNGKMFPYGKSGVTKTKKKEKKQKPSFLRIGGK